MEAFQEGERNFGKQKCTAPCSLRVRHLVGDDHLVARFHKSQEPDLVAAAGTWPAALEGARPVQAYIERAGEGELVGEGALDEVAVTDRDRAVDVPDEPNRSSSLGTRRLPLLAGSNA